jgi:hypothetical protein
VLFPVKINEELTDKIAPPIYPLLYPNILFPDKVMLDLYTARAAPYIPEIPIKLEFTRLASLSLIKTALHPTLFMLLMMAIFDKPIADVFSNRKRCIKFSAT